MPKSGSSTITGSLTATDFILSSDKRLKDNIKKLDTVGLDIEYKSFIFKSEPDQERFGVIAQELEKVAPELVREDANGFKAVSYTDLLVREVNALKQANNDLEARLERLENLIHNKV